MILTSTQRITYAYDTDLNGSISASELMIAGNSIDMAVLISDGIKNGLAAD